MNEFATTAYGQLVVQNQEGTLSYMSFEEYAKNKDKVNPLTNQ